MPWLLLFTVFVVSTCGLIYELVAGTLSSYLLGDSVMQFSTVIGVYLFSMGIGAYLSRFFKNKLLQVFIQTEILTGLVGGLSSILLFICFGYSNSFRLVLYTLVMITGTLVGLEIPLVMRILKDRIGFSELVSKIFTFDYVGALFASLLFPVLLVPVLGLIRTSTLFGMMNTGLALYLCYYFRGEIKNLSLLIAQSVLVLLILMLGFVFSEHILSFAESHSYAENIIYSASSPYQRIVVTRNQNETRLYLNNNLQFSSADEYRYHEALVHPAVSALRQTKNVLVLGGGDGMAAREILKYATVKNITLVDLDEKLTGLFATHPALSRLNGEIFKNPALKLINEDAFEWLKNTNEKYDAVIIDFPDPSNYAIGKLYSTTFYKMLSRVMADSSVAVVQSTSPLVAPNAYWCVHNTLQACGYQVLPYHTYVPSFGEWGFFLFSKNTGLAVGKTALPPGLKYYTAAEFAHMTHFSDDMKKNAGGIQRLDNQVLVEYFEREWEDKF